MSQALPVYSRLRDNVWELVRQSKVLNSSFGNFAHSQLHYYGERCQSVNLLLQDGRLWDCEIVMRSALECVTRFIFVCIADENERANRVWEYSVALNQISDLARSEKAKAAVDANGDDELIRMLIGGVVLDDEDERLLRDKWSRKKRAALKQKWSFSEMIREITQFKDEYVDLRLYKSLLHSYGLSSHLIHADQTAINLNWDRNHREDREKEKMIRAHMARLLTDQVDYLYLCLGVLARVVKPEADWREISSEVMEMHKAAEFFHAEFGESQAHKY